MSGQNAVYKGSLSRNVIRIFNLGVMTAGVVNPGEGDACEILSPRDARQNTYRRLVFRGDRLVGMVLVNRIEQGGVLMSLIQSEIPITAPPPITGSMNIMKLLTEGLNDVVGATFAVEPDPERAAVLIRTHIEAKRKKLGLPHLNL